MAQSQTDTAPTTPTATLLIPEVMREETTTAALTVTTDAKRLAVRITSNEQYEEASEYVINVINTRLAKLDELCDSNIKRWFQGHREAIADKKRLAQPFIDAREAIDSARKAWVLESKRRQELEQRQLAASMTQAAEEQTALQAAEMFEQGNTAEGDALLESLSSGLVTPVSAPPPLTVRTPKADGTSVRMLKKYRLLDPSKLSRDFLIPDDDKIGKLVRAVGKDAEEMVGKGAIQYYEEPSIASRKG